MTTLSAIISFVASLMGAYAGSYVKEKGKNLATKEDIEKITKQIESVKATIQLNAELQRNYASQKREALLRLYDSLVAFNFEVLCVGFGDLPIDKGHSLLEYQKDFRRHVVTILKDYQRLIPYCQVDEPVMKNADAIFEIVVTLENRFRRNFGNLKMALLEENMAHLSGAADKEKVCQASDMATIEYNKEVSPHVDAFRDEVKLYLKNLNSFLRESINSELLGTNNQM